MFDSLEAGEVLLADRAYDSDVLRAAMEERGVMANIKPMPNRVRHPVFNAPLYKLRNAVERFFSKIKHYRAIAARYEKNPENYMALIKLAAARIWMRFMGLDPSAELDTTSMKVNGVGSRQPRRPTRPVPCADSCQTSHIAASLHRRRFANIQDGP